ncbi:MAG: carbohydrate kinase, partial [Sediminibacterium sp.]|nr:carbohydrate kinase [Sediminibacterium sp.]
QYPEPENAIISPQSGWAEQSPDMWWEQVHHVISNANATKTHDSTKIAAIGISYQMHGLVMVNKAGESIRNSIIWCDSRAIAIGDKAFEGLGKDYCMQHLLNSPANFTASKLAWVQQHEPAVFEQIHQIMLPGDFIAFRLTGTATTTPAALSEGIFWDFPREQVSQELFDYFGWSRSILPPILPVFAEHGRITTAVAQHLGLPPGIPVTYKAGDQQNNAWSLQALAPGEVAATAGTSGVIYAVTDQLASDPLSRVNTFAHVNHDQHERRLGVLLCINGVGILNNWIKKMLAPDLSYDLINQQAAAIPAGSDGLVLLPFGNGAERMLENKMLQAHINHINFNLHSSAHLFRAAQEGIAFAFRYGFDIIEKSTGRPSVIRAGKANLFLSEVFTQTFVNITQTPVELYATDGSAGAARGALRGLLGEAAASGTQQPLASIVPEKNTAPVEQAYHQWLAALQLQLTTFSK